MPPSSSKRRNSNQTSTRAEAIKAACKRADEQWQDTPPPEPSTTTRDKDRDRDTKKPCSTFRRLSAAISDTDETDPNHHHTHSLNHNHRHAQAHAHAHTHGHAQVPELIRLPSDSAEDGCLHCHKVSTDIQVCCDECQAYICPGCHWCHEYQANHEIRVCDRCDAFYCRNCDEMDQCDDCREVVCTSCSTLLSCKFCGGGLCEECATACGRWVPVPSLQTCTTVPCISMPLPIYPLCPSVAVLFFVVRMLNLLLNVIHVAFPIVMSAWHQDPKIQQSSKSPEE